MKKVLTIALAAAVMMSSAIPAFAASNADYVTTTSYVLGQDGKVSGLSIATTVNGKLVTGEMLTYLAHTGDEITNDSIVYIDQKTYDGATTPSFSFTTTKVKDLSSVTVTVKGGSSEHDGETALNDDAAPERTVTFKYYIDNVEQTSVTDTVVLPSAVPANDAVYTYTLKNIKLPSNYKTDSLTAKINNNVVTSGLINAVDDGSISVKDDVVFTSDHPVEIYIDTTAATSATTYDETKIMAKKQTTTFLKDETVGDVTKKVEKLTVFGICPSVTFTEVGVAIGKPEGTVAGTETALVPGLTKYPSKSDLQSGGKYAIQLVNQAYTSETKDLTEGTWYAQYYVNTANGYIYSNPFQVNKASNE